MRTLEAMTSAVVWTLTSCGGAHTPAAEAPTTPPQVRTEPVVLEAPQRGGCGAMGGMTVEGQLGSLAPSGVSRVLRAATDDLAGCYRRRVATLPFLAGRIDLKIRVGTDGAVRWALPTVSSLGDRETERCMMDRARTLRFDPPCGGEAEVTFPMELAAGEDARPATEWASARMETTVRQHRTALARCRGSVTSAITLTVYAGMDGRVVSAGASVPDDGALPSVDCILHEVTTWRLPLPGSWYARATVQIP